MSAARGRMFTTNDPQLVMTGDNPGGNETVAFIPHDNPGPILRRIARIFERNGLSGGIEGNVSVGSQGITIILNVNGSELVPAQRIIKMLA